MTGRALAIVVMARAPRPGPVKTRLQPLLGPDGCARLQDRLIRHTVALAQQVAPGSTHLAIDGPAVELCDLVPDTVRVLRQRGDDLGARMTAAVHDVARHHAGPIVVIGTDAPTMTTTHLSDAANRVESDEDIVFGPALDGGYYLIAMHQPRPEVFAIDVRLWGGPEVLSASVAAASVSGLRTGFLTGLRDLDTPRDAEAFLHERQLPADIADALSVMGAVR